MHLKKSFPRVPYQSMISFNLVTGIEVIDTPMGEITKHIIYLNLLYEKKRDIWRLINNITRESITIPDFNTAGEAAFFQYFVSLDTFGYDLEDIKTLQYKFKNDLYENGYLTL